MLHRCIMCGVEFEGRDDKVKCPACTAKTKHDNYYPKVCAECGADFLGGPAARYCPDCRYERTRERDKRHKKQGPKRPLGSTDRCVACGKEYTVTGGAQKYCPDCRDAEYKRVDNAASRRWNAANDFQRVKRERRHQAKAEIVCVICGKAFIPTAAADTCSPECRKALQKRNCSRYESTHRKERNEYHKELLRKKLEAMTPEELETYKEMIRRCARENYAKRKAKIAK